MMRSHLDTMTHQFVCPSCRKPFEKVLRDLQPVRVKKVTCPQCGTEIDMRVSKSQGDISKAFDLANQMDVQARERTGAPKQK
jgi:hypothetical protein